MMNFEPNQMLKTVTQPPITKEQLKQYALASGDDNPIHLDDQFAQQAGFPSVIVHGMLSMGFLGDCLSLNFPNERFELKNFNCRFKKVTFPGDVITSGGKIRSVNSDGSLTVTLWTETMGNRGWVIGVPGDARKGLDAACG